MMALDSALVILMAELLAALIILALALFFIARNKRNNEMKAIDSFINQLDEQASFKNQPLDHLLTQTCGLDKKTVQATLQEVSDSERALMQKVIQLFLKREMALLNEIDQAIGNLSEPYCRLLENMTTSSDKAAAPVGNTQALERINQQLVRQLDTAMQTIDEITSEYTRVFSGNQTELELENSSKKMLQIFQDSIRNLKQTPEA